MLFFKLSRSAIFVILWSIVHVATSSTVKVYDDTKLKDPIIQVDLQIIVGCHLLPETAKHSSFFVLTDTCVKLYRNPTCTDSNEETKYLHGQANSIKYSQIPPGYFAFGPCGSKDKHLTSDNLTHKSAALPKILPKLHADVYRLELIQYQSETETTLILRPQTVVENRVPNSFPHQYKANVTIQEFLKVTSPIWTQNITTIQTTGIVEFEEGDTENQFGPFLNVVNIQSHIQRVFTKTAENINVQSVYSFVQSQNFNVDENIAISACSIYNITSSLTVNYWDFGLKVYVLVTGVDDQGQHIPAEILKDMLPENLYYVESWDEYTVQAESFGYVETEYGNTLATSTAASVISNC